MASREGGRRSCARGTGVHSSPLKMHPPLSKRHGVENTQSTDCSPVFVAKDSTTSIGLRLRDARGEGGGMQPEYPTAKYELNLVCVLRLWTKTRPARTFSLTSQNSGRGWQWPEKYQQQTLRWTYRSLGWAAPRGGVKCRPSIFGYGIAQ